MKNGIRRALYIILIMSLFVLSACGDINRVQKEDSSQDHSINRVPDAVCSVKIKINPQFEVFLNNEYFIIQINYLNADAKQAFSDVNVLSAPFDEGMLELLNALYSNGYTKNNSIQITWAVQNAENAEFDPSIIANDFEEIIAEFSSQNGISVSSSMVDPNDAALQTEQQVDIINDREPEDDWELLDNITIERDASGNIVKYIETDDTGSQYIYNAQKQLICKFINTENGYVEINYDENGNVIQEDEQVVDEWERMDNITVERDSNGNVISYVETDSNGSKFTYNAKKQKLYALIYHDTGYSEIYYNESGQITKHTIYENDGSETELFYYANGNKKQVYTLYANGEFRDVYYSESGSRTKFIVRRNASDGSYVIDYDIDGNGNTDYQYAYASDGTVWYNEFDSNGNQILEKQKKIK